MAKIYSAPAEIGEFTYDFGDYSYEAYQKAEEAQAPVEVVIVKNASHNCGNKSGGVLDPSKDEIIEQTVQFFVNHLRK